MVAMTLLATLPSSGTSQRLQVYLVQGEDGGSKIELREQHHAEGIGWFDQRSLAMEPAQLKRLQAVLGMKAASWDDRSAPGDTIPFPRAIPGEANPFRAAVGDLA